MIFMFLSNEVISCMKIIVGLDEENVCKNAGRCVNVGNSHKCECQPGYTGSYCEEMVDECKSNPCRNGATCKDYQGTYECIVSTFNAFLSHLVFWVPRARSSPVLL